MDKDKCAVQLNAPRTLLVMILPFQTERFNKARVGRIVTEGVLPVLVVFDCDKRYLDGEMDGFLRIQDLAPTASHSDNPGCTGTVLKLKIPNSETVNSKIRKFKSLT